MVGHNVALRKTMQWGGMGGGGVWAYIYIYLYEQVVQKQFHVLGGGYGAGSGPIYVYI